MISGTQGTDLVELAAWWDNYMYRELKSYRSEPFVVRRKLVPHVVVKKYIGAWIATIYTARGGTKLWEVYIFRPDRGDMLRELRELWPFRDDGNENTRLRGVGQ
ncbi:MAG TPA: hypothetical protein PKV98_18925 [Burkholderiaceae bacterium]|nr:hypothetical protein [Burkholderiaceae bacterium]